MRLHYFSPDEFIDASMQSWYADMSSELLVRLDVLRHQWGSPIQTSKAVGAMGRKATNSKSQHNIERWGEVRAIDLFPSKLANDDDVERFVLAATDVGFTGIGIYPHWSSGIGVHLDVREGVQAGYPATWGGVNNDVGRQVYVSLSDAMQVIV